MILQKIQQKLATKVCIQRNVNVSNQRTKNREKYNIFSIDPNIKTWALINVLATVAAPKMHMWQTCVGVRVSNCQN